MKKKEWLISICMLCVLALAAGGITAFVLRQNEPANVEAFENRFLDLTELRMAVPEEMERSISQRQASLAWKQGDQPLVVSTAVQPLPADCSEWQITLGGGGTTNGLMKDRTGYQVWLGLCMMKNGEIVRETWTEMPLLAERADRTRIYTVSAETNGADGWRLDVVVKPLDGVVEEGTLILQNWEVHAR